MRGELAHGAGNDLVTERVERPFDDEVLGVRAAPNRAVRPNVLMNKRYLADASHAIGDNLRARPLRQPEPAAEAALYGTGALSLLINNRARREAMHVGSRIEQGTQLRCRNPFERTRHV